MFLKALIAILDAVGEALFPMRYRQPALAGGWGGASGVAGPGGLVLFNQGQGGSGGGQGGGGGRGSEAGGGQGGGSGPGHGGGAPGSDDPSGPGSGGDATFTASQLDERVREAITNRNYAIRDLLAQAGVIGRHERIEDVPTVFQRVQRELEELRRAQEGSGGKGKGKGQAQGLSSEELQAKLDEAVSEAVGAKDREIKGLQEKLQAAEHQLQIHVVDRGVREACAHEGVNGIPTAVLSYLRGPEFGQRYKLGVGDPDRGVDVMNPDGTPAWDPVKRKPKTLVDVLEELKRNSELGWMFKAATGGGATGPGPSGAHHGGHAPSGGGGARPPAQGGGPVQGGSPEGQAHAAMATALRRKMGQRA